MENNNEFLTNSGTNTGFATAISFSGEGMSITSNGTTVKAIKKSNMPVKIFFGLMKKKMGILKDYSYKKRMAKLEQAMIDADTNGQISFSEELMKKLFVLTREAEMWAHGKKIFLEREIYNQFCNKTQRKVSLTALKNYARVIPQSVLNEKKKCDGAKLYDGYVVMHYDDGNTVKETEKETKERREKDPILFGIVENSSRLYFVDDWEDEFCDLTLDDIVDLLELEDKDITMTKNITIS